MESKAQLKKELNEGQKIETAMTPFEEHHMRKLQELVLEILLVIDKLCKDNHITYYLGEGTLLGAVRHHGFIPWDDDVDILMPRKDYERFVELAQHMIPDGYVLDCYTKGSKYYTIAAHVQITRDVPYKKKHFEGIALSSGPALDIFPLDYVPDDHSDELQKRGKKTRVLRRVLWVKSGAHKREKYEGLIQKIKLFYPAKILSFILPFDFLHGRIIKEMTKTNNETNEYLADFASLYPITKETFPTEWYGIPQMVEFEGHMFPAPQEPIKMLNRIYGDYMILPPVQKRLSKHAFHIDLDAASKGLSTEDALVDTSDDAIDKHIDANKSAEKATEKKLKIDIKMEEWKKKLFRIAKRVKGHFVDLFVKKVIDIYIQKPVAEKTIIYDAFSGLGILDSQRAIFKRLLERAAFRDYTHIWAVKDAGIAKHNLEEYKTLPNVKIIKRNSFNYLKCISTAKYILCNSSIPSFFARREEQIYLNTWHGIPLKSMGYERAGQRIISTENVVPNFLNATHIIGANKFTAEKMFKTAYKLNGIYSGTIIDEPLPRTDMIKNTGKDYILKKLNDCGIITEKKIIVYAPTWKGANYKDFDSDVDALKSFVKILQSKINSDEYQVYLRVHYFLYRELEMDGELNKICIPFMIDTDELLSVTEILISDYSSIFFDFLSTGRPILFYVPDLDEYVDNRGINIPMEDMPGPVTRESEDIAAYINNIEATQDMYRSKYQAMCDWCIEKEDGQVCDRVINTIFLGNKGSEIDCSSHKKKLLFMAEWRSSFVHQSQLIKFFDQIDYNQYDVTLLAGQCSGYQKSILADINPQVRILINNTEVSASVSKRKSIYKKLEKGKISLDDACSQLNMWHEWRRLVGYSDFDLAIQIQPVSSFFNWLLVGYISPVKKKILIESPACYPNVLRSDKYNYYDLRMDSLNDLMQSIEKMI